MQLILPGEVDLISVDPIPVPTGAAYPDPGEADIRQALDAMRRGDIEFVILEGSNDYLYIQAAGQADGPYTLEVQWGALDRHFIAQSPPPTFEHMQAAFLAFAQGDYGWKSQFTWELMQF